MHRSAPHNHRGQVLDNGLSLQVGQLQEKQCKIHSELSSEALQLLWEEYSKCRFKDEN